MDTSCEDDSTILISRSENSVKQWTVHLILVSIAFETAAFYSFEDNISGVLQYNDTFNMTTDQAITTTNIFEGTNLVSLILFAIISDAKVKRFNTIVSGFILYLIGFIWITIITYNYNHDYYYHITPIIILVALGSAAVRSNIIAFGIDQIQGSIIKSRYIDKFIVAIHMGTILTSITDIVLQADMSSYFFRFYLITVVMLAISVVLFLIGWRYYLHVTPYDSVITNLIPVVKNAFETWIEFKKNKHSHARQNENDIDDQRSTFLDYAKVTNNGKFQDRFVNDVKLFRNAVIIFTLILPYKVSIYQLYNSFTAQASSMLYDRNYPIIVNLVMLSETISVIVGVIILNLFVYKYLRTRNYSLPISIKFILSMCLAFLTMCVAGIVEIIRQKYCCNDAEYSDLSIYVQLIQDIIMGFAQLFALLASFEFACLYAPRSAQSVFMSFHYFTRCIGSFIIDAYMNLLQKHSFDLSDFRCSVVQNHRIEYKIYFFIIAGVLLLFLIIFIICQRFFRILKQN